MSPLTRRRLAGWVAVTVLAAVAVVAAALELLAVAVAALTLVAGLLFVGMLQLRQRIAELQRHTQQLVREQQSRNQQTEEEQRRLLATLEQDRRAGADRHRALLEAIDSGRKAEAAALKKLGSRVYNWERDQTQEVEALLQLFRGFEPRAPMPSSGHWALNPTDLLELWSVAGLRKPALVLELGSGTSSVWLGYAVERHGGRVVSVDHDPAYAEHTRAQLRRHGLDTGGEVRDAALRPVTVDGETYQWYDPETFAGLSDVDLLVVDGPPGGTGPQARYPALRLLEQALSPQAVVLLDDADRPDEQEILRRWCDEVAGLVREPATVGHLAVLSYTRPV